MELSLVCGEHLLNSYCMPGSAIIVTVGLQDGFYFYLCSTVE